MRKIYSFVLIAAGLLIGTQGWAETNTCKIGAQEYPSVAVAIAAVPTTGVSTTITMIKDETIDDVVDEEKETLAVRNFKYASISAGQVITLDLNGCKLVGKSTAGNESAMLENNDGSLTICDNSTEHTGLISYERVGSKEQKASASTIINHGFLNIKSGRFELLSDLDACGNANYIIDNVTNGSLWQNVQCIIEGGVFYSTIECLRTFANSTTYPISVTISGGNFTGEYGLIFIQDPGDSKSGMQTITIEGGNYTSDELPLVRLYTSGGKGTMEKTSITMTGDIVSNVPALQIQHTYNQTYPGTADDLKNELQDNYMNVFNITGGTYSTEDYIIKCAPVEWQDGILVQVPGTEQKKYNYILPTLLDGATLKDKPTNYLEPDVSDEERKYPDEITIVPLDRLEPANKDELISQSDDDHAAIISQDITLEEGDTVNAYHVTVKSGADLIVKDGAVVRTDDGGVNIEDGGKITVEAGGTLIVGARGLKTDNVQSLYVTCTTEKSGVVVFSPEALLDQNPQVVVKMESNARRASDEHADTSDPYSYYYQQFGIPTTGDPNITWNMTQAPTGFSTYNNGWSSVSSVHNINTPFKGYEMFSYAEQAGTVYTMSGYLNSKEDATVVLANPGWNFFANSYMAPMDIEAFFDGCYDENTMGDKVGLQITIFKGHTNQYETVVLNDIKEHLSTTPFTSIAPMQGFWMYLNGEEPISFKFKYADCVWGHENVNPILAPTRKNTSASTRLQLTINAGDFQDAITLTEDSKYSDLYDNGADAHKMMNPTFNIFANVEDNEMARVATDNLNGTQLSFQAGNAVEYTMTISNCNNDNFVLVDHLTNAQVAMTDGATYTFVATPNETVENRFEIRKAGGVVTNLAETKAAHAVKGIYTAAGQYVGKADRWNTLPAGMYIVDGIKMAK